MNSAFDERYDIRLAVYDEIEEVMDFIDKYWKKGHILATNREFFEYEQVIDGQVNVLIAKDKQNSEIQGVLGFLPASSDKTKLDIWGVVWKVRDDIPQVPFLGIELKKRLMDVIHARYDSGPGANPKTSVPILSCMLKYFSCKMNHYYRLSDTNDFKIAKIENKIIIKKDENIEQKQPLKVNSIDELKKVFDFDSIKDAIPYKDAWYINRRFFEHPVYKYDVYSTGNAFFVMREQCVNDSKILRIVDYIGEHSSFGQLYDFFTNALKEYEYIDFYNYGFEDEFLKQAGFVKKEENSGNIIPNYFSPFVQENVDIWAVSTSEKCQFYKADGDQDRPN